MDATRLNLGSGEDYREGDEWCNVDISTAVDPDQAFDLDAQPWPLPDDQFEFVLAQHCFEHLTNATGAFAEVARVLDPGGTFELVFPIGHTKYRDPTHVQFWTYETPEHVAGTTDHAHELDLPFTLDDRELDWWIGPHNDLIYQRTEKRLEDSGPGSWLCQVAGLAGEVRATFTLEPDGGSP